VSATKTAARVRDRGAAEAVFRAEGCSTPRPWSNAPGDTYGWHQHGFHKVLFCLAGSIVFHVRDGGVETDVELGAGDRLDLEPGTPHAAAVGRTGCRCIEASR
jgi:mannose-6-phosphate isomerase-like protein (cupin superfamily)